VLPPNRSTHEAFLYRTLRSAQNPPRRSGRLRLPGEVAELATRPQGAFALWFGIDCPGRAVGCAGRESGSWGVDVRRRGAAHIGGGGPDLQHGARIASLGDCAEEGECAAAPEP
jgi:hypothetical protein